MSGYCTTTDLGLVCNVDEQASWGDDDGNGSADTGMVQGCIDQASYALYGVLKDRYTTMDSPATYTTGTYRGLEFRAAVLGMAYLRSRQGGPVVAEDHPSLVWALRVRLGLDDLA